MKIIAASNKISNIQGMRVIAFLMVFFSHSFGTNPVIGPLGSLGVQIFLVISGYLIAIRYGDKSFDNVWLDGLRYSWKKIKKFYLLHFLTLTLFVVQRLYKHKEIDPFSLILNVTLTQAWYPPVSIDFNGVAWFLSAIVVIYFLVPFTVNFMSKKSTSQLLILFAVIFFFRLIVDAIAYRIFPEQLILVLYFNPLYRYTEFLFGFIGALIFKNLDFDKEEHPKFFSAVQIFFVAAYIAGCNFFFTTLNYCWLPVIFLLLATVLVIVLTKSGVANILGIPPLVHLGNISFELFLLHPISMLLVARVLKLPLDEISSVMVVLILTIIAAEIFHKLTLKFQKN